MEVILKQKSVYGNILLYPVNDNANMFAKLINAKTFHHGQIGIIESLGFKVIINKLP